MYLDSCRSQAADEGDAIEAHSPEEGRAGGLHHKVLQENPQLCEQGPDREGDGQNIRRSVNPGLQKALHVYWRDKRKKKKGVLTDSKGFVWRRNAKSESGNK